MLGWTIFNSYRTTWSIKGVTIVWDFYNSRALEPFAMVVILSYKIVNMLGIAEASWITLIPEWWRWSWLTGCRCHVQMASSFRPRCTSMGTFLSGTAKVLNSFTVMHRICRAQVLIDFHLFGLFAQLVFVLENCLNDEEVTTRYDNERRGWCMSPRCGTYCSCLEYIHQRNTCKIHVVIDKSLIRIQ